MTIDGAEPLTCPEQFTACGERAGGAAASRRLFLSM